MELTQRQKKILKECISKDSVSVKDLLESFDISLLTLKTDIEKINEAVHSKAEILMNSNNEYYLDNKSCFRSDTYFLADTLLYDNQVRFNKILGYFLKHKYTKLEDLEKELNLERSTFLPCLKHVKNLLKNLDIEVLSKPKYGYYLVYTEENYRYACVLYFTLIKEKIDLQDPIYTYIFDLIFKNNIEMSDTKFIQLYYYLKVVHLRHQEGIYLKNEESNVQEIVEIFNLNEEKYAECFKYVEMDTSKLQKDFLQYLEESNLKVLLEECRVSLFHYILKMEFKKKLKIHLNVVSSQLDSITKESPVSFFLAEKILDFVGKYDESDLCELASILYNEIVTRHFSYKKLNLLILSTLNKECHESIRYRLANRYSNYINRMDSVHFYELTKELVNQYDAVLYFQKDAMILPGFIEKKYALDYYINYNDFTDLFEKMIVPRFIYTSPFNENEKIETHILRTTDEMKNYPLEIYNQLGISILFTNGKSSTSYYKFEKVQKLHGKKIKDGFIFFINVKDNMLSLKMAEHLIRLVTQSSVAKEYLLTHDSNIYTNVLHHRSNFIG